MKTNKLEDIYADIKDCILKGDTILITSHTAPDGDSIGSQLAILKYIKYLGKSAVLINQENIPYMYSFLPQIDLIREIKEHSAEDIFDLAIILDCSDADRIGEVAARIDDNTKIINIDHHPDNTLFGDINLVNPEASSVGEMLAEVFIATGFNIDRETAELLYTAILTDTGRFRFQSTGRRTMEIVGHLIDSGANPRHITDQVYYSLPPSVFKIIGELLSGAEFYEEGQICLMALRRETLKKFGANLNDLEGLAENTLHGKNVVVGALLKEFNNHQIKVSLRSRDGINVSQIAHKFGGGGHINASGFTINASMEDARDKLLTELKGLLNDSV